MDVLTQKIFWCSLIISDWSRNSRRKTPDGGAPAYHLAKLRENERNERNWAERIGLFKNWALWFWVTLVMKSYHSGKCCPNWYYFSLRNNTRCVKLHIVTALSDTELLHCFQPGEYHPVSNAEELRQIVAATYWRPAGLWNHGMVLSGPYHDGFGFGKLLYVSRPYYDRFRLRSMISQRSLRSQIRGLTYYIA